MKYNLYIFSPPLLENVLKWSTDSDTNLTVLSVDIAGADKRR